MRCQQTAATLGRKMRTHREIGLGAGRQDVLELARWPTSNVPVLIVGHQPTLGQVAAFLLVGVEHPLAVKKGVVWWLRQREREAVGEVLLYAVQGPDAL